MAKYIEVNKVKEDRLERLYRILRHHDKEIIENWKIENELTDEEYFDNAMAADFVLNALTIVTNLLDNNKESLAVDDACRGLIEYSVVCIAQGEGDLNEDNYKIFRNLYMIIEDSNIKKVLDKYNLDSCFEPSDKDEFIKDLCDHFGCTPKKLKKYRFDDPFFFLKNKIDDEVRPDKLIKKYFGKDSAYLKVYNFFSILVHPHFYLEKEHEKRISAIREKYIDTTISLIEEEIDALHWNCEKDAKSFEQEVCLNPVMESTLKIQNYICNAFDKIADSFAERIEFHDYNNSFNKFIKGIYRSMCISCSLSHFEQVASQFKLFFEHSAVYYYISMHDLEKYRLLVRAFALSTMCQFSRNILSEDDTQYFRTEFEYIYSKYEEKYDEIITNTKTGEKISKNEFVEGAIDRTLYALNPNAYSYQFFANNFIKFFAGVDDNSDFNDIISYIYKMTCDLVHSSGYKLSLSFEIWEVIPHLCFAVFYKFAMKNAFYYVINMKTTESFIKTFIEIVIECYNEQLKELSEIAKKRKEDLN